MSRSNDIATTSPTVVSDKANTSTGHLDLPSGTTAQRPSSPTSGNTRFNSTTESLEFYDGTSWISTNLIPTINSVTGSIYAGVSRTLTLSVTNATDTIDVKYYESGTLLATDSGRTVSSGSATSTVPSAVYGQTAGDTISIQVLNQDGTPSSNIIDKTVLALPSGSSPTSGGHTLDTTSVSGYRIHTFTASGTLTNYIPNLSCEYLIVAGGGGAGGVHGTTVGPNGAGGAGGYRCNVSGESSGGGASAESGLTLTGSSSGTTYTITVGAGGASVTGTGQSQGNQGGISSIAGSGLSGMSSTGGGGGGATSGAGENGGSGGGSGEGNTTVGTGTTGQGYDGGASSPSPNSNYSGGAGGGAGAPAQNSTSTDAKDGGVGVESSINGTATYRAGGGGAAAFGSYHSNNGAGGNGGGGAGQHNNVGVNGTDNKGGGGGGGASASSTTMAKGGSGVVIIRYQLP